MHRILIFDESGVCVFNLQDKTKKKGDIFDKHLVSSFLTALGNFSDAIFDEKIQQIKYKQMSLVLMSYPLENGKKLIGVAVARLENTISSIQRVLYEILDAFVKGGFYKPHFESKDFDKTALKIIKDHTFGRTTASLLFGNLNMIFFALISLYLYLFLSRPYDTVSMPLFYLGSFISGMIIGSKKVVIYTIAPLSIFVSWISVILSGYLSEMGMVIPIAYPETVFFMVFGLSLVGAILGSYITEYLFLYPPVDKQNKLYKININLKKVYKTILRKNMH